MKNEKKAFRNSLKENTILFFYIIDDEWYQKCNKEE